VSGFDESEREDQCVYLADYRVFRAGQRSELMSEHTVSLNAAIEMATASLDPAACDGYTGDANGAEPAVCHTSWCAVTTREPAHRRGTACARRTPVHTRAPSGGGEMSKRRSRAQRLLAAGQVTVPRGWAAPFCRQRVGWINRRPGFSQRDKDAACAKVGIDKNRKKQWPRNRRELVNDFLGPSTEIVIVRVD